MTWDMRRDGAGEVEGALEVVAEVEMGDVGKEEVIDQESLKTIVSPHLHVEVVEGEGDREGRKLN
jgi:hypothetical protein